MSDTMDPLATEVDQKELAPQLLAQAREQGIDLAGPDRPLNRLTKNVLETALEAEMDEHLGYERHDASRRGAGAPATAPARRPCWPRSDRWRSTCLGGWVPV